MARVIQPMLLGTAHLLAADCLPMGTITTSYLGRKKLNIFLDGPLFTEHSLFMRKVGWTLFAHIVNKMAALQREREKRIRFKKINF